MAVKPRLELRQRTALALTPSMRNALSVLRMPPGELDAALDRIVARNPFLLRQTGSGSQPQHPDTGRTATVADTLAAPELSFQQSLLRQIGLMGLDESQAWLVRLLVGELRDDGLLDTPLGDLAAAWQVPETALEAALAALQKCEPAGIGARDLGECLRLQLTALGLTPLQAAETVHHLDLFARADWAGLQRQLGLERTEAKARAALLRRLSPRPVAAAETGTTLLSSPDLIAERGADGTVSIRLARDQAPGVQLDEALARRARQEGFANDMLAEARAIIVALNLRGRTLRRIGNWLARHQAGFFLHGPAAMRPATRARLAAALGLHPSTIGRAIAGKSIEVEGRLWPLERFFSAALGDGEGAVAAIAVQQFLLAMIAAETPEAPLSDEVLARNLRAQGVDIARRTVAKYRSALRIPGSAARRRRALPARLG